MYRKAAPRAADAGRRAPLAAGGPETKANGFAPLPQPMDDLPFKADKPRPDGFEWRGQSTEPRRPLRSGALFGFFCYMTYDLTNQATMRIWSTKVTLMDIAWGTVATGIAAGAAACLVLALLPRGA